LLTRSNIEARIRQKLQQIQPVTLQKLAEDLACVKFPDRFGGRVLRRAGRNDEDQTTKGWPDAFVSTGPNEVDGIEATRQAETWKSHLEADLGHTTDTNYRNLSGYVFVGGYPGEAPTALQIDGWVNRFVAAGVDRAKVTILVGADLVAELCKPEYAALRQIHLGLSAAPTWFRLLGYDPLNDRRLGLFQPTKDEYDARLVRAPDVTDAVIEGLLASGCVLVRGYGAAGKTTLAELIARHKRITPNSVWYSDMALVTEEEAGTAPFNEMTEFGARGVLFVLDNAHLDTGYARRFQDHWTRHLAPLGSRLLLLGRRINRSDARSGSAIPCYELRAGVAEMIAVARRLAAREGRALPPVPQPATDAWARTFGGSDRPDETAVDLIAFTAAIDRRLQHITAGDFRLSAGDAVDAVRVRYLQPLRSNGELPNILRLAALAQFEIPLTDEQLPDPVGLTESVNSLGLVVHDHLGLEARRHYRLVHAGVGQLLLEAGGADFSEREQRLAAVAQSPGLGPRIAAALKRVEPEGEAHVEFDQAIVDALRSSAWPNRTQNLYELGNLARYAARKGLASPEVIDASIAASNAIPRLLSRAPALPAVNQFLAKTAMVNLPRAAASLGSAAARPALMDVLGASRSSDVVALIRAAPNGLEILARIDLPRWNEGQSRSPAEPAGKSISACRFFEASSRPELARAPALRQVALADSNFWNDNDLSHLSHMLRFARPDREPAERLLKALASAEWLSLTFTDGIIGHLCGALLSLANHLDPVLRNLILIPELRSRVIRELSLPLADRKMHKSRPVCLLGGFDALGGQFSSTPQLDWSWDPQAEFVLDEVAHSDNTGAIGTYELQLWLGLKALHRIGQGPAAVPARRGESFLCRLGAVLPPSTQAGAIQSDLLRWLEELREAEWKLEWTVQ
jgi:hypothetical protein